VIFVPFFPPIQHHLSPLPFDSYSLLIYPFFQGKLCHLFLPAILLWYNPVCLPLLAILFLFFPFLSHHPKAFSRLENPAFPNFESVALSICFWHASPFLQLRSWSLLTKPPFPPLDLVFTLLPRILKVPPPPNYYFTRVYVPPPSLCPRKWLPFPPSPGRYLATFLRFSHNHPVVSFSPYKPPRFSALGPALCFQVSVTMSIS